MKLTSRSTGSGPVSTASVTCFEAAYSPASRQAESIFAQRPEALSSGTRPMCVVTTPAIQRRRKVHGALYVFHLARVVRGYLKAVAAELRAPGL